MENNQEEVIIEDNAKPLEKNGPKVKKRKAPLIVAIVLTIIGLVAFAFYLLYISAAFALFGGDNGWATVIGAILLLPLAILIGMLTVALNIAGVVNSAVSISSEIKKIKVWGIVLTVLNALMIIATLTLFLIIVL